MSDTSMQAQRGRFGSALLRLILLAGFATAAYGVYAWNAVKEDEYSQLDNLARFAAKSASLFFDRFHNTLDHLGQEISAHGGTRDLNAAHALMVRYQRNAPEMAATNLFDANGDWVLSSIKPVGTTLPSLKAVNGWLEDFNIALTSPKLWVGRPVLGAVVPGRVIPLKYTVRSASATPLFVLSAVIPLHNQQQIWNNLDLPEDAVIGIIRRDGYFQSRFPSHQDESLIYTKPWRGPVNQAAFGATPYERGHSEEVSPVDQVQRLVSFQHLDGYPLVAYVGVPRTKMWRAWARVVQVPFALIALLAIGGILTSRHLSVQYEAWAGALNARQRRLELLNLISSSANAGTPLLKLVDEVLQQLANQLPQLRVSYSMLCDDGRLKPVSACAGVDCEYAGGNHLDLSGAPELRTVLRVNRPLAIANTASETSVAPILERLAQARIRSWLLVPMTHAGELLAVLSIESHLTHEWSEDFIALTRDVAAQLSVAFMEARAAEERMRAVSELEESRERFRSLAEMSSDWFWEQDKELRFTYFSPGAQLRLAEQPEEALGKRPWEVAFIEDVSAEQWDMHKRALLERTAFSDFVYRYHFRGEIRYASVSGKPMFDAKGAFIGYRGIGKDITAQRANEARIHYLARNDELTGLANRSAFQEQLAHAIRQSHRHGRAIAVLFIDLDRFKNINDTLGHEAGDTLLKEVARRLTSCLRESDTLARWGGDEFVATLEEFDSANDVALIARRVLEMLAVPYMVDGRELVITASVGISAYPEDGLDAQTLLKAADIAMYRAKEAGKNNFQYYSPQMNVHSFERLTMEANLRRALERGEFLLHYQPKVDLRTGALAGAEALIRWQHPDMGLVSPMQFIPLAEETGLIVPIGSWVLRTACAQARAWQAQGLQKMRMAVNISSRQFSQAGLLDEVIGVLDQTGLDADLLELEITESMLMDDPDQTAALLNELKAIGIHLAIDDFGTGYSSLTYLKRFPVSTLKIDRSFVKDVPYDADDVAITLAIVGLAHNLRIRVTAEGVETEAQRAFLRRHGCDEIQGYLVGRPLPVSEFEKLVGGSMRTLGVMADVKSD
jgi:diguanylate cyclase (GGDEF)-like protein/PAS domain S-box-containing protein